MSRQVLFLLVAVLASTLTGTAAAGQYPDGMVSYWKFDEGEGLIAHDLIAGNHGTLINGVQWASGIVGGSVYLDGVDDYIDISASPSLDITQQITIEAWGNVILPDVNPVITKYESASGKRSYFFEVHHDQSLHWFVSPNGSYSSSWRLSSPPEVEIAVWTHIVATYDGSIMKIFMNGTEIAWKSGPAAILISDVSLNIGRADQGTHFFNGFIDELAIYDRALSSEEILQHYQNGLVGIGYELAPTFQCNGFEPPMASYPVTVRGNRALPFKAEVLGEDGGEVSGPDITAPPVIQIWYEYGAPEAEDVSDQALPAGQGTEGNQFVYTDEGKWQFNLKTKNYTAPGIYTVFMDSGDASEYRLNPSCTTQFVRR